MNPFRFQLQALLNFLSAQKIRYVILGGIAVSLYGEPRLTADIDVNIVFNKEKLEEFLKKAKRCGFSLPSSKAKIIAKKTGVVPLEFRRGKIYGKFDIIIAENVLEYNAIERGRVKKIDSNSVRLISPEDLIIHKIASSRPRDYEDLKGILARQRGKLDVGYIRYWLKKIDRANKRSKLYRSFKALLEKQ